MFDWLGDDTIRNGVSTLILLLAVLVLRFLGRRALEKSGLLPENRLRIESQLRNLAVLIFFFGGAAIWAEELQSVVFSLFALAAALAILTKELFSCVLGTLVRSSSGGFFVGDRIEVGSFRGDVVDISLIVTKLLEIGPANGGSQRTGRIVSFPNSLLLTTPVINETRGQDYNLHTLRVTLEDGEDYREHERHLVEAARRTAAPYIQRARAWLLEHEGRFGVTAQSVEPRVNIVLEGATRVLVLRYPTPAANRSAVEQRLIRHYLDATSKAEGEVEEREATQAEDLDEDERVPAPSSSTSSARVPSRDILRP